MGRDLLIARAVKLTSQTGGNEGRNAVTTDGSVIIVSEGNVSLQRRGKITGFSIRPENKFLEASRAKVSLEEARVYLQKM